MAEITGYWEESRWAKRDYGPKIENKLAKTDTQYIKRQSRKIFAVRHAGGKCEAVRYVGGKSIICGYNHPIALSFHHNDSSNKTNTISNMIRGNGKDNSQKAIKEEIEKCTLMCVNCHSEIHSNNNNIPKKELLRIVGIGHCIYCGYESDNIASLHFHHRDRKNRNFSISSTYNPSSETPIFKKEMPIIKKELKKCDVICANCHILAHSHIERFLRLQKQIYDKSYEWKDLPPRRNKFKDKKNKRYERNHKSSPEDNPYKTADHRAPGDIMVEEYYLKLDGLGWWEKINLKLTNEINEKKEREIAEIISTPKGRIRLADASLEILPIIHQKLTNQKNIDITTEGN